MDQQQQLFHRQQKGSESSFKVDPVRYRLPPTTAAAAAAAGTSPTVTLNQFRGIFPTSTASYPSMLDVLHEEEESSVASPATVQLVENQQQLEQLNLHHNFHGGRVDSAPPLMRCGVPPSIVITGVGRSGGGGRGGAGAGTEGRINGGAIAMR